MRKVKDLLLTFGYKLVSLFKSGFYDIYTRYDSAYGDSKVIRYVKEGDKIIKRYERFALEDIVKKINKKSIKWLDIGSGLGKTQEVLKKISEKFGLKIEYLGIEVREKAAEEAQKYGANVILGDATEKKTLEKALKILKGNPDVASFIGSIQHFDPDEIKRILEFTKPKYVYVRANLSFSSKILLLSYLIKLYYPWTSKKIIKTLGKFRYKPFYLRENNKELIDILFKRS